MINLSGNSCAGTTQHTTTVFVTGCHALRRRADQLR
jgi:hypothetical protein